MATKKGRTKTSQETTTPDDDHSQDLIVVGIGASAGGLEALRALLSHAPSNSLLAYVVAQHLDPKHRSMLSSLLGRTTELEVMEAEDKQSIQPNKVYIIPPGKDVTVSQGELYLSEPSMAVGPKPSIDFFMTSLAEDKGDKAVGIILSGTGSDGAHGMRAIKAEGGITIVQQQSTARYDGMPRAAIETGLIDLILPPERIIPELLDLLKYPPVVPEVPAEVAPPDSLQTVFQILLDKTDCDFSDYKLSTIQRRIERRMAVHKLAELDEYIRYLKRSPDEVKLLFKDILISVTSFFRDSEAFEALAKTIRKMIKNKKMGDSIRIWVPGCATGEESYSIALLLTDILGDRIKTFNIQIFGTDIDVDAIASARKAIYPEMVVQDMNTALRDRYFVRENNTFQVIQSVREMVVFARQDLTRDPPFSRLDLVSCRNVLIYFNTALQKRLVPIFHYVLSPGGHLFLGKSESVGQFDDLFVPVDRKWKIYARRETVRAPAVRFGPPRAAMLSTGESRPRTVEKEIRIKDLMNQAIVDVFGYPAVIIDDRQEVVHVYGDVSPYLTLPTGDTDLNILNMARSEIRVDMRALIHKSTRENISVHSKVLHLTINGINRKVTLRVRPIAQNGTRLTLVLFEGEIVEPSDMPPVDVEAGDRDPRVAELEHELTATREHLHTTVEELETANEELQSLNEELQSSNEELQSSNEELETANEELQSTNEELTTVNEELQVKSAELAAVNADLENILKRVGVAMVIIDHSLRVTRFTPLANNIFDLAATSSGQVITSVPCRAYLPNLHQDLTVVISEDKVIDQEVSVKDHIYLMRILPYYSEHRRVVGAMLMFIDQTDVRQAKQELEISQRRLAEQNAELRQLTLAVEQSANTVIITDMEGNMVYVNPRFEKSSGYTAKEALRQNPRILNSGEQPQAFYREMWETITAGQEWHGLFHNKRKDGSLYWEQSTVAPVYDEAGQMTHFISIQEDITERVEVETALRDTERLLRQIAVNYPAAYLSIIEQDLTISLTTAGTAFEEQTLDPDKQAEMTLETVFGEQTPLVKQNYLQAFAGEKTSFDMVFNGQRQSHTAMPLPDEDGRITRILAVVETRKDSG